MPQPLSQQPTIYFYLPEFYWQAADNLLSMLDRYLQGEVDFGDLWTWHVQCQPSLKADGVFAWIIQPYLHLRARGLACELVRDIPTQGIVILPRKFVEDDLKPSPECLFVMIKSDSRVHPYCQLHVVENPHEEILNPPSQLWKSYYIPHFPHPGLRPRDPQYGDRFENLAYFGLETNLAPELRSPSWQKQLATLGFNWSIIGREQWHDYTNVDAIVAIRSFDLCSYSWKPASKLYNAWHAGVPAILGQESSLRSERTQPLDYLEITSPEQLIASLKQLRDDKILRQAIVAQGRSRAAQMKPEKIADKWLDFLEQQAFPEYDNWLACSQPRQKFFMLARRNDISAKKLRLHLRRFKGQSKYWFKSVFRV